MSQAHTIMANSWEAPLPILSKHSESTPASLSDNDPAQRPPLILTLPFEVHNNILTHLPWPVLANLRLTHRLYAHNLLPPIALSGIHDAHKDYTYNAELYCLRSMGYANAHWTGFTQGWGLSRWTSLSTTLPCYHCLRWLPAADIDLQTSAFSRGMGTGRHDLARSSAKSRVCVDCGVRCGLYVRGDRVRHQIVCHGCGGLGERVAREWVVNWYAGTKDGLLKGKQLRWHYFCKACIEQDLVVPASRAEFEHYRRWDRYEKGMEAGRRYREEKGRKLREEKGIVISEEGTEASVTGKGKEKEEVQSKHLCPIMKDFRMCQCWKNSEDKAPDWLTSTKKGSWPW